MTCSVKADPWGSSSARCMGPWGFHVNNISIEEPWKTSTMSMATHDGHTQVSMSKPTILFLDNSNLVWPNSAQQLQDLKHRCQKSSRHQQWRKAHAISSEQGGAASEGVKAKGLLADVDAGWAFGTRDRFPASHYPRLRDGWIKLGARPLWRHISRYQARCIETLRSKSNVPVSMDPSGHNIEREPGDRASRVISSPAAAQPWRSPRTRQDW